MLYLEFFRSIKADCKACSLIVPHIASDILFFELEPLNPGITPAKTRIAKIPAAMANAIIIICNLPIFIYFF